MSADEMVVLAAAEDAEARITKVLQQSLVEAQIEIEKQRLHILDRERKIEELEEERCKLLCRVNDLQFHIDHRLEDVREALKAVGWSRDKGSSGLWRHGHFPEVDFETAVAYAIRFGSAIPPSVGKRVKVSNGLFKDYGYSK